MNRALRFVESISLHHPLETVFLFSIAAEVVLREVVTRFRILRGSSLE